jgi:hypothetical protein
VSPLHPDVLDRAREYFGRARTENPHWPVKDSTALF